MLSRLELENFLLFKKSVFTFSPGLNAVSGETGAGKSLVARALSLALGGRGGLDTIRSGCDGAVIRAEFVLDAGTGAGLADAGGVVRVERVVRRDGGGISVNGRPVTAQMVRQDLAPLVDFAAQNEHLRLADPAHQRELLDAYGRLHTVLATYQTRFREADSLAKRLSAGRQERELVRLRRERIREELAALDAVAYDPEADGDLEARIREGSNATAVVQAAAEAAALVDSGEPSALEALAGAWKALGRMAEVSPRLAEAGGLLEEALDRATAAMAALAALSEGMEADPRRLDALIERAEKLKALAKRLECGVADLPAVRERLWQEGEDLAGWDVGEEEIRRQLEAALPGVAEAGAALGAKRREAGKKLARAVNRELAGLGMEQAGFTVACEPVWQAGMPLGDILTAGVSGLEEVMFYLSPNPGEAPSAIAGGASGGEASRAMLALKAALSAVYRPDVMFLDEIDAGVGGRLGSELGRKLRDMARSRQVIVITHLPQIAAYADSHLKVEKKVRAGRTTASVAVLDPGSRVREVASMIHGSSADDVTVTQARKMLREAGNLPEAPPVAEGSSGGCRSGAAAG
ncbi:MAG: AAA family ATPase [Planctomycetes bacterium]|nr:AAA family ATPase [Planctomycetota bacterium]